MNIFDEIDDKEMIYQFYELALLDYRQGATIEDLETALKAYEEVEMYLQCAGIKEAIDYIVNKGEKNEND